MTREIQKQTEIFYAENLSRIKGYDWIVEVPPNEDDWPDLLIKTSNDKFGLEVRDRYVDESRKGSIEKRDETYREELLSELSARYYAKSNIPIRLDIRGPFLKDHVEHILNYLLTAEFQEGISEHDIIVNGNKTRLFVEKMPSSFAEYSYWKYMNDTLGWIERIKDEDVEVIVKEKSFNIDGLVKSAKNS
jgi:hypothetical protein